MTSVQRETRVQAIAGGLDFAVEWLEDEADAEPKGDHRAEADTETFDYLVWSDGRIPLQIQLQKTDKTTYVAHGPHRPSLLATSLANTRPRPAAAAAACRLAIYFLFVSKVISGYSREGPSSKGDFLPSRYSPKKAPT